MNQATNETKRNVPAIAADIKARVLRLTFSHGQTIEVDADRMTDEIVEQAMMHGFKQKLVDAAAISCNPETGRPATIEDKFAAVKEVYDRLMSGQWNKARGDGSGAGGGLLFRALCRMYADKTPDALKAYLAKKTDAEKTALRANPKVAAIIAEIRAEVGAKANIDTDALLDEIDGE